MPDNDNGGRSGESENTPSSGEVEKSQWDRRKVIKTGAAAGTGLLTGAAGCTSSPNQGNGGNDGGSGQSGSGGNGGQTNGSQSTKDAVQLILAPTGFQGIVMDHIYQDTNILKKNLRENNFGLRVSKSWESAAIFTSGGADFGTFGSLEAAKLAGERDLPLAVNANLAPQFMCIVGKEGGPYDPDTTGSAQASMDKLEKTQDRFALGGWGGGTGIMMPLIVSEAFGYTFTDGGKSDFTNITTSEYAAVPKLILDDNVVMGTSSPLHGAAPEMAPKNYGGSAKTITTVWQLGHAMAQLENFSAPQLNSWTCSQEYMNSYPKAPESVVKSFQEGINWFFESPLEIIEGNEEHLRQLGIQGMDQARYVIDWGIELELDNDLPVIYEDIALTEEFIENDKNLLESATETGFLNEGWREDLMYNKIETET